MDFIAAAIWNNSRGEQTEEKSMSGTCFAFEFSIAWDNMYPYMPSGVKALCSLESTAS